MGGKKKVEQPAQQSIADKGHNNQLLLRSSDGK